MEELKSEIWESVIGFEGIYEVSNLGRVKSVNRILYKSDDKIQKRKEKFMKAKLKGNGYFQFCLSKNGIKKYISTHRLISLAFIPNPKNKTQVNHKNGIKTDNRIENLEWVTHSENALHSSIILGNKPSNKIVTRENVFEILSTTKKHGYRIMLSKKLGISIGCIKKILAGILCREWIEEFKSAESKTVKKLLLIEKI
mgnify:FL=1